MKQKIVIFVFPFSVSVSALHPNVALNHLGTSHFHSTINNQCTKYFAHGLIPFRFWFQAAELNVHESHDHSIENMCVTICCFFPLFVLFCLFFFIVVWVWPFKVVQLIHLQLKLRAKAAHKSYTCLCKELYSKQNPVLYSKQNHVVSKCFESTN